MIARRYKFQALAKSAGRSWTGLFLTGLVTIAMQVAGGVAASPFAASVVDYSPGPSQYSGTPYMDSQRAIGRPYGNTSSVPDNSSVVTLGDGGSITLAFDHDVIDDPANPGGYDFIVFSNAYFVGGDPSLRWQEPAFVEISPNNTDWYLLLPNVLPSQIVAAGGVGTSSLVLQNYAEYNPTLSLPLSRTPEERYTVPDRQSVEGDLALLGIDAVSGGGDAFDIADAVRQVSPGVPQLDTQGQPVPAGITSFRYIRLTDAAYEGQSDPELGEISAEIDAAADIEPAMPVGAARQLTPGAYAVIWGARVTAAFAGEGFWIEQPDRSAGLKIISIASVQEGDLVAVTGHVINPYGEEVIADALVTIFASGSAPPPVGVSNRTAHTDMVTGMLVRVWGNRVASGVGWVSIDDGSDLPIIVEYGSLATVPGDAQLIAATGVLTQDASGNRAVRIRKAADITY